MADVRLTFPPGIQAFLRRVIGEAGGNEVFFLGRVAWAPPGGEVKAATVEEVDVVARGTRTSVLAFVDRADGWDLAIHNHPSGALEPSEADLAIAHELGKKGVGFAIISNDAGRHYLAVNPFRPHEQVLIDPEEVRAILSPGGPIAQALDSFEPRGGQVEMAVEVTKALNDGRILASEAGTGVGKSFAYLVPSVLWAARNRQKVIVATGTINLQEQLVRRDLPFLASVLPIQFEFALAKGRGNYACKRKVKELEADLAAEGDLFPSDEKGQLRDLLAWTKTSASGDRSDLSWMPPPRLWEEVMSETDKSLKVNCEFYEECFYYRSKRAASRAHVIVANHHLFFADLAVRRALVNYEADMVLPAYKRVVFDEAHHIEDVATEFFGARVSRAGVLARLGRLVSARDRERGAVPALARRLRRLGDSVAADAIESAYPPAVEEARMKLEAIFDEIEEELRGLRTSPSRADGLDPGVAFAAGDSHGPPGREAAGIVLRHKHDPALEGHWASISRRLEAAQAELAVLLRVNDRALETLERSSIAHEDQRSQSLELTSFGGRLQGLLSDIGQFRDFDDASRVRWTSCREATGRRERTVLEFACAPIRVADDLKSSVYDPLESVVLTSATLSVAGKPDFIADRLGLAALETGRFSFREHPSPFDFERQAAAFVPTDLPLPGTREFDALVPEAIFEIVSASRGRAFVLFTSYGLLRKAHAALERRLLALGLVPLAQGQAERSRLLDRFRASGSGVLFGTDSFWEGVDVKGRALECVVITRLPFRVPTEPIQEARAEELEARGLDPFTELTVPQAVLKLKQGFGRLIRSSTDRGVVAILDRRILTKAYGKLFLRSLPPARLVQAPLAEVVRQVEGFFGAGAGSAPPPW